MVLPQLRVEPVGGVGLATSGPPGASVATYMCRALLPARKLPAAEYACHVLLRGQQVAGLGLGLGVALTLPLTLALALALALTLTLTLTLSLYP